MSEFKDCPTIPELKEKLYAFPGEVKKQPMPTMPAPFECEGTVGEGYAACVTTAKVGFEKAWSLVMEYGEKKAESVKEEHLNKLARIGDKYAACSDPDHQCRRDAGELAKRLTVDFSNVRVAVFQEMVRMMDPAKEAFIEEAKGECEEPVEPPADEGDNGGEATDLTPDEGDGGETKPIEGDGATTEEPTTEPTGETPPDQPF